MHRILTYRRTLNLGDFVQTYALSRLLPPCKGVLREGGKATEGDKPFVVNGFLWRPLAEHGGPFLIAGAHLNGADFGYPEWLRRTQWPIGVRDPWSLSRVRERFGIEKAELVGCATLTLDRYSGPRQGEFSVDIRGPGTFLTHHIGADMGLPEQWALTERLLGIYRQAEVVHTSRLHVALPCLAFGTPVRFSPDPMNSKRVEYPMRLSLLEYLGIRHNTIVTKDVSEIANTFISFLARHLELDIRPGSARFPCA